MEIKEEVDANLFLGQSNFHAAGVAISTKVKTYILDPYFNEVRDCLLYTSPSPRDGLLSRMPSSA